MIRKRDAELCAEIEREGMLSDMETLRAEKHELRAEIEQLQRRINMLERLLGEANIAVPE